MTLTTDERARRHKGSAILVAFALAASLLGLSAHLAYAEQGEEPTAAQEHVALPAESDDESVAAGETGDASAIVEQPVEAPAYDTTGDGAEEAGNGAEVIESVTQTDVAAPEGEESVAVADVQPEADAQAIDAPVEQAETLEAQAPSVPDTPTGAVSIDEDTYVMQSKVAADRVVQAAGTNPAVGARVATAAYTGDKNQQWVARREGNSLWYRLYVRGSNYQRALAAIDNGKGSPNVVVVDVAATEPENLLMLLWSFIDVDGATYRIANAAWSGMCLDVDGSKSAVGTGISLQRQAATATKNQRFALFKRNPEVAPGSSRVSGAYKLALTGTQLVVDIAGGNAANGTNAQVAAGSGSKAQRIYLERTSSGYYIAWVVGTGKVLDAAANSIISGDNVRQWEYKGYDRQLWALTAQVAPDGSTVYLLQNKKTGLYLGASSSRAGANLVGLGAGEAHRVFSLTSAALMDQGIYLVHPASSSKVAVQVRKASTKTASLLLAENTGAISQKFQLVAAGGTDLWRIRTGSSGGWLTWTGDSTVVQTGNGKTAATAANTWRALWLNGGIVFVNVASERAGTPRALDTTQGKSTKGTGIIANKPAGSASQHLVFEPTQLLGEGYYFLRSSGGKYLQVKGTSAKNKADIRVASLSGAMGQFFKIEFKDGYMRIANIFSQKYLQAVAAKRGANVYQRRNGKSTLQLWESVIVDGGRVAFVNVGNRRLVLGAAKGGSRAGANVRLESNSSSKGQIWKPVELGSRVMNQRTSRQKDVVRSAKRTPSPGYGLCAAWITYLFENAGLGTWGGDACDQYRLWCKSSNLNKLRPGMIVAVSTHSHTPAGRIWGHVCVYVGNGKIMDNAGYIRTMSLYDWIAWYGDRVTPKWGWLGGRRLA